MQVPYTAEVTAVRGREGHVRSTDGAIDLDLVIPNELGGPGGPATNPEQLFAAGYAASFEDAVRHVARQTNVPVGSSSVTAHVGIGIDDFGAVALTVELHVRLPELGSAEAARLVAMAHQACPYSAAVRGNVDVDFTVDAAAEVG